MISHLKTHSEGGILKAPSCNPSPEFDFCLEPVFFRHAK